MALHFEPYSDQLPNWPAAGRHVLAQFDEESGGVCQAYHPEIGLYAARHGIFGGGFSFSKMTRIKPNFCQRSDARHWG